MILRMLNLERYTKEKQLRIVKKYFNSEKLERFKGSINSSSFKSRYNEMTINNLISTQIILFQILLIVLKVYLMKKKEKYKVT